MGSAEPNAAALRPASYSQWTSRTSSASCALCSKALSKPKWTSSSRSACCTFAWSACCTSACLHLKDFALSFLLLSALVTPFDLLTECCLLLTANMPDDALPICILLLLSGTFMHRRVCLQKASDADHQARLWLLPSSDLTCFQAVCMWPMCHQHMGLHVPSQAALSLASSLRCFFIH